MSATNVTAAQVAEFLQEALMRAELLARIEEEAPDFTQEYAELMQPTMDLFRQDMLDLRRRAIDAGILDPTSGVGAMPLSRLMDEVAK